VFNPKAQPISTGMPAARPVKAALLPVWP